MTEHVGSVDLRVIREPHAPAAGLMSADSGKTVLALNSYPDDPDRRSVVLVWSGCRYACLADPNDEAISGHRPFKNGLSDVLRAGAVRDSDLIRALQTQSGVHPLHDPSRVERSIHHIVPLKECVAEVVTETVSVQRVEGNTLDAAIAAMGN